MAIARRLLLGTPGFEAALCAEARRHRTHGRVEAVAAGLVAIDAGSAPPADFVFARQQMPDAIEIRGASIAALAEAAFTHVEAAIDRAQHPWALHVFPLPSDEPDPRLERRAALVAQKLDSLFAERRRRASRRRLAALPATDQAGWLLIQVLLLAPERAWASVATAHPLPTGGTDLSPFPAGVAPVAIDRTPPSRAYLKLEEAFVWMDRSPGEGETCVDLGAAPGSWSLQAARRGARVVAVDRAPLEAPAAGHPLIAGVVGNALSYTPPRPVHWLLCDVICEPHRTIALVDKWLEGALCGSAVVTIKFKGRAGYGVLGDLPALLGRHGVRWWRVKHLAHNKNEVTLMLRR